jgi:hypothetical protein
MIVNHCRKWQKIYGANCLAINVFQVEDSRHRSPINGVINIITALVAYMHYPNKPSLELEPNDIQLLQLCS